MATSGNNIGNGSPDYPWDMETALNATAYIKSGHTIWIYGGDYQIGEEITSTIYGSLGNKITIRGIPDDWKSNNRPVIHGGIRITGNGYLRFQNIVMSYTVTERFSEEEGSNPVTYNPIGAITKLAPSVDLINCIIIDSNSVAIGDWEPAPNSLNYGNLIHNCGWYSTDRDGVMYDSNGNRTVGRYGHGHGFYMQKSPTNDLTMNKNNLFLSSFGLTFSAFYTNGVSINNISMIENLCFGFNGSLGYVGNGVFVVNAVITGNVFWNMGASCGQNQFGGNAAIENNVFNNSVQLSGLEGGNFAHNRVISKVGGVPITLTRVLPQVGIQCDNNDYRTTNGVATLNGESVPGISFAAFQAYGYEANGQHLTSLPTTNVHHVWPNEYPDDIRMGIVVIENWEGAASDTVDLSALDLTSGQTYRLFNAFNYLGDTPLGYISDGDDSAVSLDLSGWTMAKPTGTANGVAINEPLDPMPDDLMVFIVERSQ